MTARLVGALVFLLTLPVFAPPARAIPQTQPLEGTTEPSGPKPSPAVEKILNEASRLAEAKQALDSLHVAEQALDAARKANDRAGEALAQQSRAKVLQDLQRTKEAVAAWQEAALVWGKEGDGPEQLTALVQAGLLCVSNDKSEAEKFLAQALSVGKSQSQRPSAVARALQDSGLALSKQLQQQTALDWPSKRNRRPILCSLWKP
jgi:tetratricopeptide (TPR) repeat protein